MSGRWQHGQRGGERRMRRRSAVHVAVAVAALTAFAGNEVVTATSLRPHGDVVIHVLSNRADLVSGGDAMVQVVTPPGVKPDGVVVDVGGRPVTSAFAVRADGHLDGVVTGL